MPIFHICHPFFTFVIPAKAGISSKTINTKRIILNSDIGGFIKTYYVYILASGIKGTLYTGVTDDLIRRVSEHRQESTDGFTKKYHIHRLVYYCGTEDINSAIQREKQIKKWNREWKIRLIEEFNPKWRDLYDDICI